MINFFTYYLKEGILRSANVRLVPEKNGENEYTGNWNYKCEMSADDINRVRNLREQAFKEMELQIGDTSYKDGSSSVSESDLREIAEQGSINKKVKMASKFISLTTYKDMIKGRDK